MFNTLCYYLNFVSPRIPAAMRRAAYRLLARRQRLWTYGNGPQAGYCGGIDVPVFGTVAFQADDGALTFTW